MRLTIKQHNAPYLRFLATQLAMPESEAINYLLTNLRMRDFSFKGSPEQFFPVPQTLNQSFETPNQSSLGFEPQERFELDKTLTPMEKLMVECDPIIAKLAPLIETF
jgi:hypothetical protein